MTSLPTTSKGPYLPSSQVFPDDESQRLIVHTDLYTQVAEAVNQREISSYQTFEEVNGQTFFNSTTARDTRPAFRKVFSIGAIAAGATLNTAHSLTNITSFTRIYGTVITAAPDHRPIPYVSITALNQQIEINVTTTNIVIINGGAAPNITSGIVVLEFLKS